MFYTLQVYEKKVVPYTIKKFANNCEVYYKKVFVRI